MEHEQPESIDREFDDSKAAPEVVEPARTPPPPELVDAVLQYFAHVRDDLARRVLVLDEQVGFIKSEGDLSARVAKLEAFLGVRA